MAFCIKLTWWDSNNLRGLKDASVRPMPLLIEQYSFLTFQLKSVVRFTGRVKLNPIRLSFSHGFDSPQTHYNKNLSCSPKTFLAGPQSAGHLAAHIWNVTAHFLRCVCVCGWYMTKTKCVCGSLMPQSGFFFFFLLDISVPLLSQARLYLGHWWKGMRTKCGFFFLSEGIVCVIGLSKCFISRPQNGCVKFAVRALLNWHWEKSILLKMSGSGAWSFHHSYFAVYFLFKMKGAHWCGSHWAFSHRRVISCFTSISLSLKPVDFEVWH